MRTDPADNIPGISVVIPIHNEEGNLPELYRRLTAVLGRLVDTHEIIFVDDGSRDQSWRIISELNRRDERVVGISLSRNFGHHIAITAGLDLARGASVVLMDGDLQDPPEEIPKLYAKYLEGFDVVVAIRVKRDDPPFKKAASWVFQRVLKWLANVEINLNTGIFRIMSGRFTENLNRLREKSRLIVGMINWVGFSQTGVETERQRRFSGKTKYSLWKLFRLAWHGITSFSYVPLEMATYLGFVVSFASFSIGLYMIAKKLIYGIPIIGYASIIVSLFFIGGVILLVLGIIGEYIGRIFTEVQDRPLYIVRENTREYPPAVKR